MSDQIYCTVCDLIGDLGLVGDDGKLYQRIQEASQFINRKLGTFIPVRRAVNYYDVDCAFLRTDPFLSIVSITNNGTALASTDYQLHPGTKYWPNGPYTRIEALYTSFEDVVLTANFGLWDETESLGISGSQAAADTATLAVTNGSLLSPGMVLLIGSEQELVTGVTTGTVTAATSKLNGAVDTSTEAITVDNGAEFYRGEVIQLSSEDCYIRHIAGNVLTCTRGWNGTTIASHADDLAVGVYRTFNTRRGCNSTTAAIHSSAAISRQIPPPDVNYLARQIAALMLMKAKTGYTGRAGNAEMGESWYINEFPTLIKQIRANYRIVQL